MEYWQKLRETYAPSEAAVEPHVDPVDVTAGAAGGTWTTFVESMEHARDRASEIFVKDVAKDEKGDAVEAEAAVPAAAPSLLKSWWEEATQYIEEAKISVEEKISEISGPSEIKNDPLRKLKDQLLLYSDALEELKSESFNFAISAETMTRLGTGGGIGRSVNDAFASNVLGGKNIYVPCSVPDVVDRYGALHSKFVIPAIDEVRQGSESVTAMVTEELTKIQAIQTRFKRRDRLHKTLLDMRARVELRREKNNRKLAEGLAVDAKSMEELYEVTRGMDSIESDFRITSEQLVTKCSELLSNKSKDYMQIVLRLIEIQNSFYYRISNFCSVPCQELVESIRTHELPLDELEDLGPHPLTWRSQPEEEEAEHHPKPLPRRSSVDVVEPPLSPGKYSYRRDRGPVIRRAGTSALSP